MFSLHTPEQFEEIQQLFLSVRSLPANRQRAEVRARCKQDERLEREVLEMLAQDSREPGGTLALAGSPFQPGRLDEPDAPGAFIGNYRLLELLGEGGFGLVYLAEQLEPIHRRVALKIIKPGMDSRAVIARFEQERQALAVMDHPHVAKVFDAGVTPTGRPYFVMEYVRGEAITSFCDRNCSSIGERLELFRRVCDAVQHAHMKGIIHRDIKPNNILVTVTDEVAAPKVIDFGVAKAICHTLTDKTICTESGQLLGTPEYMSPEQADTGAVDIDTRTDVYSLGVVLYELLAGDVPFDARTLRRAGYAEIQRIIREVDPPRPSTKLSSLGDAGAEIARKRQARTDDLVRVLHRELEWVPLKAIRKDRTQRYQTPRELAEDIGRYLAGRPLMAGPESRAYRARKLLRRHKGAAAATAGITAALVLGMAGTLWEAHRAQERAVAEAGQKLEAQRARKNSERIFEFVAKALQSADPKQDGRQSMTVADAMESALRDIDGGMFKDDLETEARLKTTIGEILTNNGKAADAEPLQTQALETLQRLHQGDHSEVAACLGNLAAALYYQGRAREAEPLLERSLAMYQRLYDGDHADVAKTLSSLSRVKQELGRAAEAEPLQVQALEMRQRLYQGDHEDIAKSLGSLGSLRSARGRGADAEPLLVQALEMFRRLHKGDHPDIATSLNNLGRVLEKLHRPAEAEPLYVQALEMDRRIYAGDHPHVAKCLENLAAVRQELGRAAAAEPLFQQALEMEQRLHKGDHASIAEQLNNLAAVRRELGRLKDAEPLFQQSLEMLQRMHTGDNPDVASAMNNLACVRLGLGRAADAETLFQQTLKTYQRLYKGDHRNIAACLSNLAAVRQGLGRPAEAEPLFQQSLDMYRRLYPGGDRSVAIGLNNLASARRELGRAIEAEPLHLEALEMARSRYKGDHPDTAAFLNGLARCRLALGKVDDAEKEALEAVDMYTRLFPGGHPRRAVAIGTLALVRQSQGKEDEARELIGEAERMVLQSEPATGFNAKRIHEVKEQIDDG